MEKKIGLESMIQHPYSNNYTLTRASFGKKKKGLRSGKKYSFQLHKECREMKAVCKRKNSHVLTSAHSLLSNLFL